MEPGTISGIVTGLASLLNLTKAAKEFSDQTKARQSIDKMQSLISEIQTRFINMQAEFSELIVKYQEKCEDVIKLEKKLGELEDYELCYLGQKNDSDVVYKCKNIDAIEHFACPRCKSERESFAILQPFGVYELQCRSCNSLFSKSHSMREAQISSSMRQSVKADQF